MIPPLSGSKEVSTETLLCRCSRRPRPEGPKKTWASPGRIHSILSICPPFVACPNRIWPAGRAKRTVGCLCAQGLYVCAKSRHTQGEGTCLEKGRTWVLKSCFKVHKPHHPVAPPRIPYLSYDGRVDNATRILLERLELMCPRSGQPTKCSVH
jgi:hypothetical protein